MTNTNTIDTNNIRTNDFNSFYKKHYNVFKLNDDKELYRQSEELREKNNYFEDEVKEYIDELDEEETKDKDYEELIDEYRDEAINDIFDKIILYSKVYYEPQKFDKEIAKKCGLVAFTYKDIELLAIAGSGSDDTPKLDAYQALTTGYIDSDSKLLRSRTFYEFEFTVGKELTQEVKQAITKYK